MVNQEYVEATAEGVAEGIEDVALAFDWWTPAGQMALAAMGYATVLGWTEEIVKLEKHGISCHFPMAVNDPGGDYMWMIAKADYNRACKLLGGKR